MSARATKLRRATIACGLASAMALALDVARGESPQASGAEPLSWTRIADLPEAVSNNAVAALRAEGRDYVFSFLGLGPGRDYRAITRAAFRLDVARNQWTRVADVPGERGRLAPTAQAVGGRVYVFGGYTVDAEGREASAPAVDIYDPSSDRWTSGTPMPVPVDDAVSGVWRGRLIFLVSGWSNTGNVSDVQIYDPATDAWQPATPIPGPAVFGHAGAIVDDTIVFCGGAVARPDGPPRFEASAACARGDIDPADPRRVRWTAIPAHPGPPRYRAAAAPFERGTMRAVLFAGGTDNPYNYNGVGYDGRPSEPLASAWLYDVGDRRWRPGPAHPRPTMDHRTLARLGERWFLVGGMGAGQRVSPGVFRLEARGAR